MPLNSQRGDSMINITARGFDLQQGTKDGIDKELQRIEKMLPANASFDVTLAKVKDGYKLQSSTLAPLSAARHGQTRLSRSLIWQ